MGEFVERCTSCGHPLAAHDAEAGCTERVPGTMQRMPGPCGCGGKPVLADVLQFRTRAQREQSSTESD